MIATPTDGATDSRAGQKIEWGAVSGLEITVTRWMIEIFNALSLTELIHANDRVGHPAVLVCLERLEDEA